MNRLSAEVHARAALPDALREGMFALYHRYFTATSWERFCDDLAGKDRVVVLRDGDGALAGFSTLAVLAVEVDGQRHRALYSGDTIIDRAHWGQSTFVQAWCRLAGELKAEAPAQPLHWLLTVKGYRTYRYLPLFARRFFPTCRGPTPPPVRRLVDALARHKFGRAYQADTGVVRYPDSRGQLRSDWAGVPESARRKPDVAFFLERNPDYARGDELVCITELSATNLLRGARSAFLEGLRP